LVCLLVNLVLKKKKKRKKKEISIPGFLHLDPKTQIRIGQKLGSGGSGLVYSGVLLDSELIAQHKTEKIALKKILGNIIYH